MRNCPHTPGAILFSGALATGEVKSAGLSPASNRLSPGDREHEACRTDPRNLRAPGLERHVLDTSGVRNDCQPGEKMVS